MGEVQRGREVFGDKADTELGYIMARRNGEFSEVGMDGSGNA